ncbi:hypothetical protein FANTH_14588 [Fusarium anthophilum]|uniref:VOC domain-containing protein n=1 Tax=Fusarium anthophilum TaxID=48485 RepID=A0A8H5DM08_9HYPO|nr:hypothetical protein FANTH_14588 [Fusarium anthophilum]
MPETTFISIFAVYQTCSDLDAQLKLYGEYGFEVVEGFDAIGANSVTLYKDVPDEYYTARGVAKSDIVKTKAMKLPSDPYMHIIFTQFREPKTCSSWPAPYDRLGSRGHAFIVSSVQSEVSRIKKDFPKIKFLYGPLTVNRQWGRTTTALMMDPAGVFFELVEIDPKGPYFSKTLKAPPPTDKAWLHYMLNSDDALESQEFFKSFDMSHDSRVDFRPEVAFHPFGEEKFAKQHYEAFATITWSYYNSNQYTNVLFLSQEQIKLPGSVPVWPQRGISRYCFRTPSKAHDLNRAVIAGHKILIPESKICIGWGDTEYYYFADVDGNILTSEQWHPYGTFGEKI